MATEPPNLQRFKALYALKKLSTRLASDVLANGTIAKRFDLTVSRPVQLTKDIIISQASLFRAFRDALDGRVPAQLLDQNGKALDADVTVEAGGSGLVKVGERGFRFDYAGLFTADIARRAEFLEKIISHHTLLPRAVDELRAIVVNADFSDDAFLRVIEILETSQESFSASLVPKIESRKFALGDLLPEKEDYWCQLTAPIVESSSLPEFTEDELAAQRNALLAGDPSRAMKSISLSFCAPALVPIELFRTQYPDVVLSMLEEAGQLPDHFGLVGAFEICCDWLPRDSRFGPVGETLLDKLFADRERLADTCAIFGAGFLLATARLHQHEELRLQPAYWRRVTSAAHASLIARAFGSSSTEPSSLFRRAMHVSGKPYYLSVDLDSFDEPRWRPDWLDSNLLIANAFGRARNALERLPDSIADDGWSKRIDDARKSLGDKAPILAAYPDIGESGPRKEPSLDEIGELAVSFRNFVDNPTVENFIAVGPLFIAVGAPAECVVPAGKLIAELRQDSKKWQDPMVQNAVMLAMYIAVQHKNTALADAIADYCIDNVSSLAVDERPGELIFRVIECAAADPDRSNGRRGLAKRLETLAFVVDPVHLRDLHDTLKTLQTIDPELSKLLGKAIAAARIGIAA